jgi:Fic family protein
MNIENFQSGAYEQRYEYRAFLPNPICQEWLIADAELTDLLGRADRALGELNAFGQLIPDMEFFLQMYVAKEATESNRIEGTQTNMEDAFMDVSDLDPEERDDWAEVQNYIQAIGQAIKELERIPLSNRLLCKTHQILLSGVRGKDKQPGEFRRSQNWIGPSLKNAVFVPPHHEHIQELMSDMEKFLHAEHLHVHPLLRIAIAHYQFETIHPFLDGNGRIGRLMISLYLTAEKLLAQPCLYLSDYMEKNKTAYVDHLMAVREGNHLRSWLVFFLTGIEVTAKDSARVFREILALKQNIEQDVMPHFSTRRQAKAQMLMQILYAQPVIDIKRVSSLTGTATNTAISLVRDFVKYGILEEITGQRRNRLFIFRNYISLFSA